MALAVVQDIEDTVRIPRADFHFQKGGLLRLEENLGIRNPDRLQQHGITVSTKCGQETQPKFSIFAVKTPIMNRRAGAGLAVNPERFPALEADVVGAWTNRGGHCLALPVAAEPIEKQLNSGGLWALRPCRSGDEYPYQCQRCVFQLKFA